MLLLGLLPLLLLGLTGLLFVFAGIGPGIVVALIVAYLSYAVFRFIRKQLATQLETGNEGIELNLFGEDELVLPWSEVTYTGVSRDQVGKRNLFVYAEESDKLVVVPDELDRFAQLLTELKQKTDFYEFELHQGETLKDKVKQLLEQE